MDSHMWQIMYHAIRQVERRVPRFGRRPRYGDVLIVAMYVWSVWHDRPLCWACDRAHYGSCFRPGKLPSVSQFCRRIQSERCARILQGVHECLSRVDDPAVLSFLDGRALLVGEHSKDSDARTGYAPGGFARGYILHAWATIDGRIPIWSVMPLNVNEKKVAAELVRYGVLSDLVLADANYDVGRLYDQFAEGGMQLITPLPRNVGGGHRPQSPSRLAAAQAWPGMARYVHRERDTIERIFGVLSTTGGGLGHLPAWVRSLERVRRWVGTKLIIYHARLSLKRRVA